MADTSPRFALPFLYAAQAQKEVFHNEALLLLDLLTHMRVESATLATPPAAPVPGQCWLVPAGATGDWSGREGQVAAWTDGGWRFLVPVEGMRLLVAESGAMRMYLSGSWMTEGARPDGYYVNSEKVVGARQGAIAAPTGGEMVDMECRASVSAMLAALRAHGMIVSS